MDLTIDTPEEREGKAVRKDLGKRKRTALEMARDRSKMEFYRIRYYYSHQTIADKINEEFYNHLEPETDKDGKIKKPPLIDRMTVTVELKKAIEIYNDEACSEIIEKRRELIRAYRDLALQSQEEYEKSCNDKETLTKLSRSSDGKDTEEEKTVTEKRLTGNSAFLRLKADCLAAIAELESAIPPKMIAPTNPEGTKAFQFPENEEFKRLAVLANDLLGNKGLRGTSIDKLPESKAD